ncbi:MAG: VWA domain-containing protein [Gammaproteobacteria bacterium]|nr:VWA domain-containing protein [Gammaproteobacteria bacterium]
MLTIEWPWVFCLTPLPLLAYYLLPSQARNEQALKVPFFNALTNHQLLKTPARANWLLILATLAWLGLLSALARPMWIGDEIELPITGRDLLLAVDLSNSMSEEDFVLGNRTVPRLAAAKAVAADFIKRREGDRIGLILFGEQAYLQAPLTFDRLTVTQLLDEAALGLAGPSTAIGDAIGLGVKRLRAADVKDKVLILMTDGANTAGMLSPQKAAELAQQAGVTIYSVGIGSDSAMRQSLFGMVLQKTNTDIDEKTLTDIANTTGGRYFRARDTAELEKIYAIIDQLEPAAQNKTVYRPQDTLFRWPLLFALTCCALIMFIQLISGWVKR